VPHVNDNGTSAWQPGPNGGVTEYTLYDSAQERGIVDWSWRVNDDCLGSFQYSVSVRRASDCPALPGRSVRAVGPGRFRRR
jgi:hypothetical protein